MEVSFVISGESINSDADRTPPHAPYVQRFEKEVALLARATVHPIVSRAISLLVILLASYAGVGCVSLPSLKGRSVSTALADTDNTPLGRALAPLVAAHPGRSGIYQLTDAHDAFAARVSLARAARRSLDVQYYLWHGDTSGMLLFKALYDAAERGVRVRLLLDDNRTAGLDRTLAALDAHPNIQVRLFNPFTIRGPRWIEYLTDFSRLNRRMHNKSFTADNQATIIGGRNVGDNYFGATEGTVFVDLDVMAIGPVVREVSHDFDRYWASASSYPVRRLLPRAAPSEVSEFAAKGSLVEQVPAAQSYLGAVREASFMRNLVQGELPFEWAATRMVSDDPAKALGNGDKRTFLSHQLRRIIGIPKKNTELVSAYFVPTKAGVDALTALSRKGVKIRILTNSFEATDVPVVHAGYAKWREKLLRAGIRLFELERLSPNSTGKRRRWIFGRSGSSLHAKTFAIDRSQVFVGSFNFDPRSARLNTELGFVIKSPVLAATIEDAFRDQIPEDAYEVHLSKSGDLYWTEYNDGKLVRYDTEPGTNLWQRAGIRLLSLLPIEWLL